MFWRFWILVLSVVFSVVNVINFWNLIVFIFLFLHCRDRSLHHQNPLNSLIHIFSVEYMLLHTALHWIWTETFSEHQLVFRCVFAIVAFIFICEVIFSHFSQLLFVQFYFLYKFLSYMLVFVFQLSFLFLILNSACSVLMASVLLCFFVGFGSNKMLLVYCFA